ncbi:MAG: hypothetical protein H7252_04335 [Cytophaga sp.]|nr:hypothetical protein [Undibacterium sp.]
MYWIRLVFFAISFFLGISSAQSREILDFSVKMTPVLDSSTHNLPATITLKNVGKKAVYIYKDLDYLIYSFAQTGSGKKLRRNFIEEVRPPPPGQDSFVLLQPGDILQHTRNLTPDDLGISRRGKYKITFFYDSYFASSVTYGLRVWDGKLTTSCDIEILN